MWLSVSVRVSVSLCVSVCVCVFPGTIVLKCDFPILFMQLCYVYVFVFDVFGDSIDACTDLMSLYFQLVGVVTIYYFVWKF